MASCRISELRTNQIIEEFKNDDTKFGMIIGCKIITHPSEKQTAPP